MGTYSTNLNLYKTNMETDTNDTFSFKRDLDDNWDKIDNAFGTLNGTVSDLSNNSATKNLDNLPDSAVDMIRACSDGLYTPVDLSVKHSAEIEASYNGNVWAWIKTRIQAGNFSGIHIGDYIPVTLTGGTIGGAVTIPANQQHKMQVAGIDTYYNSGDEPIPHHIDFVSMNTIGATCMWNEGNTNNGTSAEKNPWKSSRIYAVCNGVNNYSTSAQGSLKHGLNCASGGILQMLPTACQNVLIQKRNWQEEQYDGSKQVNSPTGYKWHDMGKIWIPHEVEICGYQPNSYNRNNDNANLDNLTRNLSKMYPLFRQQTRVKTSAIDGARSNYWLCCPSGYAPSPVCNVNADGTVTNNGATATFISVCFGFRIG